MCVCVCVCVCVCACVHACVLVTLLQAHYCGDRVEEREGFVEMSYSTMCITLSLKWIHIECASSPVFSEFGARELIWRLFYDNFVVTTFALQRFCTLDCINLIYSSKVGPSVLSCDSNNCCIYIYITIPKLAAA